MDLFIWGVVILIIIWVIISFLNNAKSYQSFERNPKSLVGNGEYDQEVVGESFYKRTIKKMAKTFGFGYGEKYRFTLVCESNNKHDNKAVGVYYNKNKVGHLSKADARKHRKVLLKCSIPTRDTVCDGVILGGGKDDLWGIFLDYDMRATKKKYKSELLGK